MKRSLLFLVVAALSGSGVAAVTAACSTDSTPAQAANDDGGPSSDARDARDARAPDDADTSDAAAPASTCELTRAYTLDCNNGPDAGDQLTCGAAKFDAWCALNDQAINSDAYRHAEALCLTHANCDGLARRDCEYRSYATATSTAAQKSLVAAYCQTCEPMDATGCAARKTTYDPAKGPSSTDDVFVAAWELNDKLADDIRMKCTGGALDAGAQADGGAANPCLKAFGSCAGDVYVNALPDCPK